MINGASSLHEKDATEENIQFDAPLGRIGSIETLRDGTKSEEFAVGMKTQSDNATGEASYLSSKKKKDLLAVLPPELWLQCLTEVANDNSMNILPLLLVSRTWYNILIASAPLWTYIYVRDSPEYIDCMLIALNLSRGLSLSVTIEIPVVTDILELPNSIRGELHRIRELVFKRSPAKIRNSSNLDVHSMDQFYDAVYELLTSFDNLPILEWITLNHSFDYYSLSMIKRTFPSTPRLKGIKFWCITEEALTILLREEISYLSSSSPMKDLFPSLCELKQLRRLILTQAGEGEEDSPLVPRVNIQSLPELQALEFYQNSPQSILPFLNVQHSSLTELQVKLTWSELEKLAPSLANLTQLRHLHFILKPPKQQLKGFELLLPPLHHVLKFQLEQQAPVKALDTSELSPSLRSTLDPLVTSPSVPDPLVTHRHMASLLDACRLNLTGVRSFLLVLHDDVPTKNLLALIEAMTSLRKLEFKGQLTKEEGLSMTTLSLEEIVLSNESLLTYLQVPNVLEVYIAAALIEGRSQIPVLDAPFIRTLSIHSSLASAIKTKEYSRLATLTWIDPAGGCASTTKSFEFLTRVLFDYSSPRKECNDFCELILRYPGLCRSLHTLEMRAYPEWDLLLHMLLRRNLLPDKSVAMITTVKIPGYPAPSLLVPLTELLGGESPRYMPPIEELCLGVVDGPYFDVNVLGCEDCIDCRMTCKSPLDRHNEEKLKEPEDTPEKEPDTEPPTHKEVKPLRGSDPPLSEELQTWFDGWSVRRTKWYAKWNKWDRHSRRKGACERHDYGELVSITGDLLHGIPYVSVVLQVLSGSKVSELYSETCIKMKVIAKRRSRTGLGQPESATLQKSPLNSEPNSPEITAGE